MKGLRIKADENTLKREFFLNPISMFLLGLLLGIGSRILDLNEYTVISGKIFSQISVWILLCTLISIYSPTPKYAMFNVFPFCINMLIAYYVYDDIVSKESSVYAYLWWSVVAVAAPLLAYIVWYSKEKGVVPRIIRWGVLLVSILSSIIVFDGFEYWDIIINAILAYFLFFQKTHREQTKLRMFKKQVSKFQEQFPEEFTNYVAKYQKKPDNFSQNI